MLTKHRRLLHQITEAFQGAGIALALTNFLALPFLIRVSAAAAYRQMMTARRRQNCLLQGGKLAAGLMNVFAHAGGDFQHTFSDIVFHFA